MGETKYIASNGIAFSEATDLKILSHYAKEGWIVKRFKTMGYELEKGDAADLIFSIDVRNLNEQDFDEYIEIFDMAGWTYIDSQGDMHLFQSTPGTKPIYTDKQSKKEKQQRMRKDIKPIVVISVISALIAFLISEVSSGLISVIFLVLFLISIVIALPMGLTLLATYYHGMRIK